jgi:hypothetical protein
VPFTDFLDQKLVQHMFGKTIYTPPSTLWIALSTSEPVQAKGSGTPWNFTEVIGGGYAAVAFTNNGTDWVPVSSEPAAGYQTQNGVLIAYAGSTGAWSANEEIPWFGILDGTSIGGGANLLDYGPVNPAVAVPGAGYTIQFAPGELTTSIT